MSAWSAGYDNTTDLPLGMTPEDNNGFFSRPIKIATVDWDPQTITHVVIDPWTRFMSDSRISNRLAHFKNFKANMRVKLMYNGNPFYYGKMAVSYIPFSGSDHITKVGPELRHFITGSQRPHVFLDASDSQSGELYLPFIYDEYFVDIPSNDYSKLGRLVFHDITGLRHAKDEPFLPVRISVFAYLEDTQLHVPTSHKPSGLLPQGTLEDVKFSSKMQQVSDMASTMTKIPGIGPLATAATIAASASSKIAQTFGYSRPTVTAPTPVITKLSNSLAVTNTVDFSHPLSFNVTRQTVADASEDEMILSHLAQKSSFVRQTFWAPDHPPDYHLMSVRITPCQFYKEAGEYHMTPSAWVAEPFQYWKGSMEVRLQIVASNYHRGRLKVVWDPVSLPGQAPREHLAYSQIIDLADKRDFVFKIGWGQTTPYRLVGSILGEESTSLLPYVSRTEFDNGTLAIYVLNELTTPGSIQPIAINVFTKMCDDFEVFLGRRSNALPLTTYYGPTVQETSSPDEGGRIFDSFTSQQTESAMKFSARGVQTETGIFSRVSNNAVQSGFLPVTAAGRTCSVYLFAPLVNPGTTGCVLNIQNRAASAAVVSMSINGVSRVVNLPAGIGSTVGINFAGIPTLSIPGTGAWYPVSYTHNAGAAIQLLNMSSDSPSICLSASKPSEELVYTGNLSQVSLGGGHYKMQGDITSSTITVPDDYTAGTPVTIVVYTGTTLRGQPSEPAQTTESGDFDAEGGRFLSILPDQVTGTIDLTSLSNKISFGRFFYYKNATVPQGALDLEEEVDSANDPVMPSPSLTIAQSEHQPFSAVHFGEQILSLRTLLKRFQLYGVFTRQTRKRISLPLYPYSVDAVANVTKSGYSTFEWFAPGFLKIRGGMKYIVFSLVETIAHRSHTAGSQIYEAEHVYDDFVPPSSIGWSTNNSPFECYNVPYYNPKKFYCSRGLPTSTTPIENMVFTVGINTRHVAYSTDEDFNLSMFVSTPIKVGAS